ncbi:MAG: M48 family metallopeptidase [Deltaproteobacteria bacterium]|nr:M48 family metallopeptidase [Deltaproteobacteria bacterium]
MTRNGRALHASLPLGRSECVLVVDASGITARLPGGDTLQIPFAHMTHLRQGTRQQILVFESPDGLRFTTEDAGILADLRALSHPAVAAMLGADATRRLGAWRRKVLLPLAALVALVVGGTAFVFGPLVDLVLALVPESVDAQVGEVASAEVVKSGRRLEDARITGPLQVMVERLRPGGPAIRLVVLERDDVNALAFPGGTVVVLTGLLQRAESPEEVAGVLAHELAHVKRRHSMRMLVQRLGIVVALGALVGDVSAVTGLLLQGAATLTQLQFSRGMETEADDDGVRLLAAAGLDTAGLSAFFGRLAKEEEQQGGDSSVSALLGTHPLSRERMERIAELSRENPPAAGAAPLNVDWSALRAALAPEARPAPR